MATGNLRNVRIDDDVWTAAGERASAEGTNLSALIRQWVADYAETGSAQPERPKIRLTAAERKAASEAVGAQVGALVAAAVDGINSER